MFATNPPDEHLNCYLVGEITFDDWLRVQRKLVYDLAGQPGQSTLVLCEHPMTFSIGRGGSRGHILIEEADRIRLGWQVHWVPRGSGTWLHAPGQLNAYLLRRLDRENPSLQNHLAGMKQAIRKVLSEWSFPGLEETLGGFGCHGRSFARIGFGAQDYVTTFGFHLNVGLDLEPFESVHCDGIQKPMTSLNREAPTPIRFGTVRQRLVEAVQDSFNLDRISIFHYLPGIGPKANSHAFASRYRESA
jgi:lipoyl(octanoyl) transferase